MVRDFKKWMQFIKYMRGIRRFEDSKSIFGLPPYKIIDYRTPINRQGIILTPSVLNFHPSIWRYNTTIFTGHGSGDKPYFGKRIPEKMVRFDHHFIAGPKNLEKLKDIKVDISGEKLIKIGNMRFDDYINGKINRGKVLDNLGIKDPDRPTILYAPTWSWGNGTLLKYGRRFCKELSPHYNLIIRPHGHDRMHISKIRRWAKRKKLTHIYFSNPSNLAGHDTMGDFLVSDLLISDMSSVMYEYLVTLKPIVVIRNDFKGVHKMPDAMKVHRIAAHYDESEKMMTLIERSFKYHEDKLEAYRTIRDRCFYFNDGKSTQRAVEFIRSLKS